MFYSEEVGGLPKTDPSRWQLHTSPLGREYWSYANDPIPDLQHPFVKYNLGTPDWNPPVLDTPKTPFDSAKNGAVFFERLQLDNGIWPCQYKGPMFMTIGYIASHYFTKTSIPEHEKIEIIRYIVNTAHPVDGGWGLHSVDKSTCFGTSLNYVILRLLGVPSNHEVCVRARRTLHSLGGAVGCPHWGKAWLSILNLYEWDGVNPAPPELWLLPYSFPAHPAKWWVHTRAVYQPLSYLSSLKIKCDLNPLLEEIRSEIYLKPYNEIKWNQMRNNICDVDLYYPHSTVLNIANKFLSLYEKNLRPNWLLKKANNEVYKQIKFEYLNTEHLCIAPVSFAFNVIVTFLEEGKDSKNFQKLINRSKDTLFHGKQGMCVMGTNGSQVWDTAFAIQYFFMSGLESDSRFHDMILKGYRFLIRSQFTNECSNGSYRDKRTGGWPFSTKEQGYTVSDCTAEAMKAIIMVRNSSYFSNYKNEINDENLYSGIDVLLSLQNLGSFHFGSFSTYEKIRATPLLELINPAEVFGNIMVEYPYVECTDSSVLGLTYFRDHYDYKKDEITIAINRAIDYIKSCQEPDGSWYGCWGVCYTYASMFALESLKSVGLNYENSSHVKKACDFLISRQEIDGGWGETMKSSETHNYVSCAKGKSLVVQTSWAVIGLILAKYPDRRIIEKGIKVCLFFVIFSTHYLITNL